MSTEGFVLLLSRELVDVIYSLDQGSRTTAVWPWNVCRELNELQHFFGCIDGDITQIQKKRFDFVELCLQISSGRSYLLFNLNQ